MGEGLHNEDFGVGQLISYGIDYFVVDPRKG